MALEKERKWVLHELPFAKPDHILYILQFYTGDGVRYRAATDSRDGRTRCYKTIKTPTDQPGVNNEEESGVKSAELYANFRFAKRALHKTRSVYLYKGLKFEVDHFNNVKLILMEVELRSMEQQIALPAFIEEVINEEVTGNVAYNNFNLAIEIEDAQRENRKT